jgi:hypothetical protein
VVEPEELLSISLKTAKPPPLGIMSSIFDYLMYLIMCLFMSSRVKKHIKSAVSEVSLTTTTPPPTHTHHYTLHVEPFDFNTVALSITDRNDRVRLINLGIKLYLEQKGVPPLHPISPTLD